MNNEAKNKGFSENQIPVYELRRKLGDKVSRGDFNNLINKIQQEEGYRLSGGEMRGITQDKRVDSVTLPSGGFRYYLEREETQKRTKKQPKKNDFNSNPTLTNFGNTNMRRRKSKQGISEFAKGDGYPCGNNGVFIPRRNKCWKHPKTGQRMRKPLTYQNYQDAKEKSQRSRTESGKTALANREQSFRDKAREKVKGWQNKTPESAESKRAVADIERIKSGQHVINKRDGYSLAYRGRGVYDLNDLDVPKGWRAKPTKLTEKEATDFLAEKYKSMNLSAPKSEPKSEPKQTPNSSGESGKAIAVSTPDKKVEQKYKDIIASSKNPIETEKALGEAMIGGGLWQSQKERYEGYLEEVKNGKVSKGYENHTQGIIDKYKPIVDAEKFINERREAVARGDFKTKEEAELYVVKKIRSNNNRHYDYYDSPEYEKEYSKIQGIANNKELPPPLTGKIPSRDLKQSVKPGDRLLVKETTYGFTDNKPTGYRISIGGEIVKVGIKNIKTRVKGEYMGKPYDHEGLVSMSDVSHVIRDGKRYKVDDSDNTPNDLGVPESVKTKTRKRAKKNDFNSNLKLAQFGGNNLRRRKSKLANFAKPSSAKFGCCCEASKPLRRRKTKQTPRLKRRGNRYA